jgi:RNA polymerase sigma-70 factor (ECF subfamily)
MLMNEAPCIQAQNFGVINPESIAKDYGGMVSSLCRRMIFDRDAAEEASQEVWLAVLESLAGFRGEAHISTWIYSIARRVILNHAKKEKLYSTRNLRTYFHGPANDYPAHINLSDEIEKKLWTSEMCDLCLTGMLHCLDNETRFIFLMRDQMKAEYPEIAQIMEMPEPAIRKSVSRSRKKLTAFLKGECYLFNKEGSCRCRQLHFVKQFNLREEHQKIRNIGKKMSFIRQADMALPGRDYWKEFIS